MRRGRPGLGPPGPNNHLPAPTQETSEKAELSFQNSKFWNFKSYLVRQ